MHSDYVPPLTDTESPLHAMHHTICHEIPHPIARSPLPAHAGRRCTSKTPAPTASCSALGRAFAGQRGTLATLVLAGFIGAGAARIAPAPTTLTPPHRRQEHLRQAATGVRIEAPGRQLEVRWPALMPLVVRRDVSNRPTALNDPAARQHVVTASPAVQPSGYQVYLELIAGNATAGQTASVTFTLAATAAPDPRPVHVVLETTKPGRPFDGIGGNFRLQFPKTDPAVLQYNLDHLPVAWGRLDLPWAQWDPRNRWTRWPWPAPGI